MNRGLLTISFAVFTMFFGAGNMVLPLLLSQKWYEFWLSSFLGFCITAVLVTLIGLIAAVLCGNVKNFFAPLGFVGGIVIQLILICIEGPFGVVPRSLIVAYGSAKSAFPDLSKPIFFAISCVILYILATNKNRIITIIGKILTPIMLVFLLVLVVLAGNIESVSYPEMKFSWESFLDGLLTGYLTYDLPGAIYFTSIAMGYLKAIGENKKDRLINGLKASLISTMLLVIVYAAFIFLGITYDDLIKNEIPEMILPVIVKGSLGFASAYMFASFVIMACLTTAVAAITIWTDFIIYLFSSKVKLSNKLVLGLSLVATFIVSLLDFSGLMKMLTPVLQIIYPLLMILTVYNIYIHSRDLLLKKYNDSDF